MTRSSEQKTQSPSNPSDSEVPHLTDLKVSYLTDSLDQRTFIGTLYDLVKAEKKDLLLKTFFTVLRDKEMTDVLQNANHN